MFEGPTMPMPTSQCQRFRPARIRTAGIIFGGIWNLSVQRRVLAYLRDVESLGEPRQRNTLTVSAPRVGHRRDVY